MIDERELADLRARAERGERIAAEDVLRLLDTIDRLTGRVDDYGEDFAHTLVARRVAVEGGE